VPEDVAEQVVGVLFGEAFQGCHGAFALRGGHELARLVAWPAVRQCNSVSSGNAVHSSACVLNGLSHSGQERPKNPSSSTGSETLPVKPSPFSSMSPTPSGIRSASSPERVKHLDRTGSRALKSSNPRGAECSSPPRGTRTGGFPRDRRGRSVLLL